MGQGRKNNEGYFVDQTLTTLTGGGACLALVAAGLRRAEAQTNLRAPKFEALPNAIGLGDTIFDPTALG